MIKFVVYSGVLSTWTCTLNYSLFVFLVTQATGEIEEHFTSDLMEPHLMVFHQEDEIILNVPVC